MRGTAAERVIVRLFYAFLDNTFDTSTEIKITSTLS